MKHEGQIKVNSENIFPVIKKWLYSDKDIFLREIVSNACDAIKKLQSLYNIGEVEDDGVRPRIDVIVDKEKKTIKVIDTGIGMTAEEVEKYITEIAFSGAEEFIQKYKDKTDAENGIIGHFGLGFYSVFMVASSVEIDTLSYIEGSTPVHWVSDGSYNYTIEDGTKETHGTIITINVSDDEKEFLEDNRIYGILRKYCRFMPYEIYYNAPLDKEVDDDSIESAESLTPVNETSPLWTKAPKDCTDQEYINFYQSVFSDFNPPLFWIHLNVDYPFNLKGILYFPQQTNKLQVMQGEIKLYCNQVYIADNIKEVVPEFLMLLKGVIDCPDLPLNVSRSFLQNDGDVAKISKHITKKVADKLNSIYKNDKEKFESYWEDIAPFIKFGCIKDEKFYDKVKDIILYKTINDEYKTFADLKKQDDKNVFYVTDEKVQSQYIKLCKENDIEAVYLTHSIDTHFISFIEYKETGSKFLRIDSEIGSALKTDGSTENSEEIINIFRSNLNDSKIEIKTENLKSALTPAVILLSEDERRMEELNKIYGGIFPSTKEATSTIVLNLQNDIIKSVASLSQDKQKLVCNHIYDLAMISHKQLSSEELSAFIDRSTQILKIISGIE